MDKNTHWWVAFALGFASVLGYIWLQHWVDKRNARFSHHPVRMTDWNLTPHPTGVTALKPPKLDWV